MSEHKHITIGGVRYDPHTGLRIEEKTSSPIEVEVSPKEDSPHAQSIHQKLSRTSTLSRSHVKAPHAPKIAKPAVKKSPMVQRFASQDIKPPQKKSTKVVNDIAPVRHPIQHKVAERQATKAAATAPTPAHAPTHHVAHKAQEHKPAKQLKQEHIEKALQQSTTDHSKTKKQTFAKRYPRLLSVASASTAILLLAGYFTYINLPSISVRVAAAQAGIAAHYPSYQPSGYRLDGPVAFSEGKVSMKFAANVGPQSFTVNQSKSNWDSGALQENYVEQTSNGNYETYNDNGLTIYSYEQGAAWVNGGILHTIDSDAALSGDQIRRIATSL